ncbi:hypothetical protein [Mycetocola saprophilus]|uniref:hypothetical protein n=1 Tax=Mycetocola saprophilus TaxID=76636 RepID=UPI0012DD336D|nr:hypothetical protein [Mycetocola saprophilus]
MSESLGERGRENLGEQSSLGQRPVSGMAMASCTLALASVPAILVFAPLGWVLALVAVIGSLSSRAALRDNPALRGSRLGLAAFLIGAAVLALQLIPMIIGFAILAVPTGMN